MGSVARLVTLLVVFLLVLCCGFAIWCNNCFRLGCQAVCASWVFCFNVLVVLLVFTVCVVLLWIVAYFANYWCLDSDYVCCCLLSL